jgi:hypothetical protein
MYYITKYGPIIYVTGWVVVAQLPIMMWIALIPVIIIMGWGSASMADTLFGKH